MIVASNPSTDKSILFISYHYPPDAAVGAKRIAKLAKSLKEKGYQVGVLTVKAKYYERHDYSLCDNDLEVYRTNMIPSLRLLYIRMKNLLGHFRGDAAGERPESTPDLEIADTYMSTSTVGRRSSGPLDWVKRTILSIIWLPDYFQGWVPFGFIKCLTLKKRYNILYSSSPYHSAHLIPMLTSIFFKNILWVSEFRDPWITEWKPSFVRTRFTDWLEKQWQSAVMKRSSRVIVVTDEMKRYLAADYPQYEDKIKVYYNGYDDNEFMIFKNREKDETKRMTIAHAGAFYIGRDPKNILLAVSELVLNGEISADDIQLIFIGDSRLAGGESIEEYAKLLGIANIVLCHGYIPNSECLVELNKADVLLLFSIKQPLQVPAKFYEYLALNKSILSITTGGMTSALIDKTRSGVNVPPDNISEMKTAIMKIFHKQLPQRNESEIKKFNIDYIFNDLREDLDSLSTLK